jgi:hypothetical protein
MSERGWHSPDADGHIVRDEPAAGSLREAWSSAPGFVRLDRPNEHAWRNAALITVPIYFVLLIVIVPRHSTSGAYTAGRVSVPAIMAAVAVGAIAANSRHLWRWWWYVVAVVALAGTLSAALELEEGLTSPDATTPGPGSTLFVPSVAGDWTSANDIAARDRRDVWLAEVAKLAPGTPAVYGEYRRGAGWVEFLGVNTNPGSQLRAELTESPTQTVVDFLSGTKVTTSHHIVESGRIDVAMGCADPLQGQPTPTVVCVWADSTALGMATWRAPKMTVDRAAQLTRQLLPDVSHPNP